MNSKTIAKLLIASGAILMLWAYAFDVTVETSSGKRVANLHRISEQQTQMVFGGFLFVGGLILFGVVRLKETPEDEARQKSALDSKRQEQTALLAKSATTATSSLDRVAQLIQLRGGFVGIGWRIIVGTFVGFWLGGNAELYWKSFLPLFVVLSLIYSLTLKSGPFHLLILNTIYSAVIAVLWHLDATYWAPQDYSSGGSGARVAVHIAFFSAAMVGITWAEAQRKHYSASRSKGPEKVPTKVDL